MTSKEVLQKARQAKDCATQAADALQDFVSNLQATNSDTSTPAAQAYRKAIGHLNDALASLNELGVRRSTVLKEGEKL